jgi:tRNA (guanine-N7-)-methyltransferase
MYANSSIPQSAQSVIHDQLSTLVQRHAQSVFRKPCLDYNKAAFAASIGHWRSVAPDAPLILDAGCGNGASSILLAQAFPDHQIIGVDQSATRLAKQEGASLPKNLQLVRADLVDYWRLLEGEGIRLARHYLLYPNPWPKIGHIGRRWHGHPVFPALLRLGGVLECRSNWPVYLEEFGFAVRCLRGIEVPLERYIPSSPLTPFERKYLDSGHPLFRVTIDLR